MDVVNEIKVSILCTVYNHEKYLRRCLDGFINQKTNFRYEAIIHDDCSTDNCKKIIEEYKKKYPDIIVPIYEKENQYSQGKDMFIDILMPKMKGKYFAICEGDDYWIDEYKLQKQYDFMENNPEYSLCTHNSIMVDIYEKKLKNIDITKESKDISCEKFILGGGGFISTNSIFAPSNLTIKLPNYFKIISLDYIWQIYLSSKGKTFCFNEKMSAYRTGVEESWTQRMKKNNKKSIEILRKINEALREFDYYTDKIYHDTIEKRIALNEIDILEILGEYKKIQQEPYKSIIKEHPLKKRIKYFVKAYMQWIYKIYKKLKKI